MEDRIIYLYVKESPRGLKYLGKTVKNPFLYTGSGNRWLNHLKLHEFKAKDLKTTILFQSTDIGAIREKGLYYSDLYKVVESNEWANLIPEAGEGAFGYRHSAEVVERQRSKVVSEKTREKLRKIGFSDKAKRASIATRSKVVIHKTTGDEFSSVRIAARTYGIPEGTLYSQLLCGYNCSFKFKNESLNREVIDKLRRKVIYKETGEIFDSITEASQRFDINRTTLNRQLKRNSSKCKFKYHESKAA